MKYLIDYKTKRQYEIGSPSQVRRKLPYSKKYLDRGMDLWGVSVYNDTKDFIAINLRLGELKRKRKPKLFVYYDDREPVMEFPVKVFRVEEGIYMTRIYFVILSNLDLCEVLDTHADWFYKAS